VRRAKLIEARKAKGLTQEQVAQIVGVERTTVGAWERGESTPHPPQRPAYAEALGVTLSELAAMLSSMPTHPDEMPAWLATYLAMEQSATALRAHEPEVVFGLLQAPGYAAEIARGVGVQETPESYVRQNVEQRQHRQKRVLDGSLAIDVVQTEQVLYFRFGDPSVMAEQFGFMADLAERPNVTLRITMFDAGQYEAHRLDTFTILSHPWGSPTVYLEGYGGGRFITEADEVAYFTDAFDQATKVALSPSESVTFIREVAAKWEARQ
jgi:transcriptional regulator with XRE-family HTH domain